MLKPDLQVMAFVDIVSSRKTFSDISDLRLDYIIPHRFRAYGGPSAINWPIIKGGTAGWGCQHPGPTTASIPAMF